MWYLFLLCLLLAGNGGICAISESTSTHETTEDVERAILEHHGRRLSSTEDFSTHLSPDDDSETTTYLESILGPASGSAMSVIPSITMTAASGSGSALFFPVPSISMPAQPSGSGSATLLQSITLPSQLSSGSGSHSPLQSVTLPSLSAPASSASGSATHLQSITLPGSSSGSGSRPSSFSFSGLPSGSAADVPSLSLPSLPTSSGSGSSGWYDDSRPSITVPSLVGDGSGSGSGSGSASQWIPSLTLPSDVHSSGSGSGALGPPSFTMESTTDVEDSSPWCDPASGECASASSSLWSSVDCTEASLDMTSVMLAGCDFIFWGSQPESCCSYLEMLSTDECSEEMYDSVIVDFPQYAVALDSILAACGVDFEDSDSTLATEPPTVPPPLTLPSDFPSISLPWNDGSGSGSGQVVLPSISIPSIGTSTASGSAALPSVTMSDVGSDSDSSCGVVWTLEDLTAAGCSFFGSPSDSCCVYLQATAELPCGMETYEDLLEENPEYAQMIESMFSTCEVSFPEEPTSPLDSVSPTLSPISPSESPSSSTLATTEPSFDCSGTELDMAALLAAGCNVFSPSVQPDSCCEYLDALTADPCGESMYEAILVAYPEYAATIEAVFDACEISFEESASTLPPPSTSTVSVVPSSSPGETGISTPSEVTGVSTVPATSEYQTTTTTSAPTSVAVSPSTQAATDTPTTMESTTSISPSTPTTIATTTSTFPASDASTYSSPSPPSSTVPATSTPGSLCDSLWCGSVFECEVNEDTNTASCVCKDGYTTSDDGGCSPVCSAGCGSHGTCVGPEECECEDGYTGDSCSKYYCESCVYGICLSPYECSCVAGFEGDDCATPVCSSCSQGTCVAPEECECSDKYYYDEDAGDCLVDICAVLGDDACSGAGTCSPGADYTFTCECNTGYTGDVCEFPICEEDCYGRGTCVAPDVCECECEASGDCWTADTFCLEAECDSVMDCHGQGECAFPGVCLCDTGFAGDDCSALSCPNDCSGHGSTALESDGVYGCNATTGECTCASAYYGDDCSENDASVVRSCPLDCSGVAGACVKPDYVCDCPSDYFGAACESRHCPGYPSDCDLSDECASYCNGNGECSVDTGSCVCNSGAFGSACASLRCTSVNGVVCNARGRCDYTRGVCNCRSGYTGDNCDLYTCPVSSADGRECGIHGTCDSTTGECTCDDGWWGKACDQMECPSGLDGKTCSGKGSPFVRTEGVYGCDGDTGECTCLSGWRLVDGQLMYISYTGDACETLDCPSLYRGVECSGNGYCSGDGTCECLSLGGTALFTGDACQEENDAVVPEGESVGQVESAFVLTGVSSADVDSTVCDVVKESLAEVFSLDVNSVYVEQCDGVVASRRRLDEYRNPNRALKSDEADLSISFVFVTDSVSGYASEQDLLDTLLRSTNAVSTSVSESVSDVTSRDVTVDPDTVSGSISCPGDCSGNGVCDTSAGLCFCQSGYSDASCKIPDCYDDTLLLPEELGETIFEGCSFRGLCEAPDSCTCYSGYSGDQCEYAECDPSSDGVSCDVNGECQDKDECECDTANTSTDCRDSLSYCAELASRGYCDDETATAAGVDPAAVEAGCLETCYVENGLQTNFTTVCDDYDVDPEVWYTGDACSEVACSGCSGQGECFEPWVCTCDDGFGGSDCSEVRCVVTNSGINEVCSGHGSCLTPDECTCDDGWVGTNCGTPDCSFCEDIFSSSAHYTCSVNDTSSVCLCEEGWSGDDCDVPDCFDFCSCETPGKCSVCDDDALTGDTCQYIKEGCPSSDAGPCSGNGGCLTEGVCTCYEAEYGLYLGNTCAEADCEAVLGCSGNGECREPNVCTCEEDDLGRSMWSGSACETMVCPTNDVGEDCSLRGVCSEPLLCECDFGFGGDACDADTCDYLSCPEDEACVRTNVATAQCQSSACPCVHGTCDEDSVSCECSSGFFGPTCEATSDSSSIQIDLRLAYTASVFDTSMQLQVVNGLAEFFNINVDDVVIRSFASVVNSQTSVTGEVYVDDVASASYEFNTASVDDLTSIFGLQVSSHDAVAVVISTTTSPPVSATEPTTYTPTEAAVEAGDEESGNMDSLLFGLILGVVGGFVVLVALLSYLRRKRATARIHGYYLDDDW